ncbi:hypothetical protein TNCV_5060011 [Trichonephila clavipes]|nr:hypothetical protein TNCV_5060011 [Trichonephila clavipes]
MIVITAEIESVFVVKDDLVPFQATVQFSRTPHHSKRRHQWVGVKDSTRNGRCDLQCPSSMHLRMVREDTGVPNEVTTCT